jgi:hypothetical protein
MSRNAVAVEPATVGDYVSFFSDAIPSWKLTVDGRVVGMAGFTETNDRLWTYLNLKDEDIPLAARVVAVRAMAKKLKSLGRDVWITCDAKTYPNSWRLLMMLGFKVTGETLNDMRVWKCPA